MKRLLLPVLMIGLTIPAMAERRRAVRTPALYPNCSMVTGTSAVRFTHDQGQTLAPAAEPLRGLKYTYGLTSMLDATDTLVSWSEDDLLLSTDAGCSWRSVANIPGADFPPSITPALGGRAYIWSDNRNFLVRYDARGAVKLKPPADVVGVGVGVDAPDADVVRIGGSDGSIWESQDAGETWAKIGEFEGASIVYRFAFDPKDLDHVLVGAVTSGASVSRDGGDTWTRATGIASGPANVFQVLFSPVDSNRAWAMGIDLDNTGDAAHGRHIFISDDGGTTFRAVVDEAPGVKLVNGPVMAAHPVNRDVLYFVFGTHLFGYGTDIFRYDAGTRALTMTHNDEHDVDAIAFSRRDPNVMYFGLEHVEGVGLAGTP
jgi:photosystem II stability/assembly factor-like uncharacterized protein